MGNNCTKHTYVTINDQIGIFEQHQELKNYKYDMDEVCGYVVSALTTIIILQGKNLQN